MERRKQNRFWFIALVVALLAVVGFWQIGSVTLGIKTPVDSVPEPLPEVEPEPLRGHPTDVDLMLASLEIGQVVFNVPQNSVVNVASYVQLLLSPSQTDDEFESLIEEEGLLEAFTVRVSEIMQANLTGSAFDIEALTSEEQPVSQVEPTEWKWKIVPLQAGTQRLDLTLDVKITISGIERRRTLRSLTRNITVAVSENTSHFEWGFFAAGLLVILLGTSAVFILVWRKRKTQRGRARSAATSSKSNNDIFVSYSRNDEKKALNLVDALKDSGASVWIDQRGIDGASHWRNEVVEAINNCQVILLMASKSSFASSNVLKEITLASEENKMILPIYLEPAEPDASMRYLIAGIQYVNLYSIDHTTSLEIILQSLERLGVKVKETT